ncbi:NACHT domain-containing protein [Saccharibacillus endophyticus]|uniref:ATP-binding protein n=1 Tax=Saccharibacillus endophyticus TaxID=2060666 RepID=A0ABQ1ZMT4_9BACL|nr:hypothetical protein [Saccharibacillus endophyticus]GGH69514.1 hypothetical protein GCM10007362_04660 [Saccharibacillus endophyticus]
MKKNIYDWERFWCGRTDSYSLDQEGFLTEPTSEYGKYLSTAVKTADELKQVKCLALLGEPGIGKTYTFKKMSQEQELSQDIIYIDLRSFASEQRLMRKLFDSPKFLNWVDSDNLLYVFLDSLDECLLQMKEIADLLADEFKNYDCNRLFLRIACRTADWPLRLEEELINAWGEDEFLALEMLPLRRCDVEGAASSEGLDSNQFLEAVIAKNIVPFAIKPVTLKMLLNIFESQDSFPDKQSQIYYEGCRWLCEELNAKIKSFKTTDVEGRLTIASRIAALTIFTNKFTIVRENYFGRYQKEDLNMLDILNGSDRQINQNLVLAENDVAEVLSTGLFTSRGAARFGWSHQTYAEFLAAIYLIESNFTFEQMLSLIKHPTDPTGKIIPQLRETAVWLASLNNNVFQYILDHEPELLLKSDIVNTEDNAKKRIVEHLLLKCEAQELHGSEPDLINLLNKLNHPQIAAQLHPYISNPSKNSFARRIAIRIAKINRVQQLKNEVLLLLLDPKEDHYLRGLAVNTYVQLCDSSEIQNLMPLVEENLEEDYNDELKGKALSALWPDVINLEQLLSILTPPKKLNFWGEYRYFIKYKFEEALTEKDLPFVLTWLLGYSDFRHIDFFWEDLFKELMNQALDNFENKYTVEAFIKIIKIRFKNFDDFEYLKREIKVDIKKKIVEKILLESEEGVNHLAYSIFVKEIDLIWFLEQACEQREERIQKKFARLSLWCGDIFEYRNVETIMKFANDNAAVFETYKGYLEPIVLDSKEAVQAKNDFYKLERRRLRNREQQTPKVPSLTTRFDTWMAKVIAGEVGLWWRVIYELAYLDEVNRADVFNMNIQTYPGWSLIADREKRLVINYSKEYIKQAEVLKEEWFGKNILHHAAMAGYKALRLNYDFEHDFLYSIDTNIWSKWSPVLFCSYNESPEEEKIRKQLMRMAYSKASSKIINDLLELMLKYDQDNSSISFIGLMEECWDDELQVKVFRFLREQKLNDQNKSILIGELLESKVSGVEEYVLSIIKTQLNNDENSKLSATIQAVALLKSNEQTWKQIWNFKQHDPIFLREVFLLAADKTEAKLKVNSFSEEFLAEIFIWLTKQFPHHEDPNHENETMAHWVGPREHIAEFRDSLLILLKGRGTEKSISAIEQIIRSFPHLSWLNWTLQEAKETTRRSTWQPVSAKDLILLAENSQKRIVDSGHQLIDVVLKALTKIEQRLHGVTPEVRDIWNDVGDNKYTPYNENEFSDYIKRRLEDEIRGNAIVVNREVELQATLASETGERTDIHVDAVALSDADNFEKITVVIEVKGNWHRELLTAMQTQLADRYLSEGKTSYGIYLVGWFDSEKWSASDSRKKNALKYDIEEVKEILHKQAEELSINKQIKTFVMNAKY